MSDTLSLTRAARLVGVTRTALQKKIKNGELLSFDGMVSVEGLLACYPDAQLEDIAEFRRVTQIKEKAFGKRVFERALPDAEVLAARITELSKTLDISQAQVKKFNVLLAGLWDKLIEIEEKDSPLTHETMDKLKAWIKQEVALAMEPGFSNPLAIKDSMLHVMTAQVTILPSRHDFLVEGQDTLLEAAMRSGIPLSYGCSGGNCGLCKARLVSGEVKKTRHHDFVIPDAEKDQGYILLCSNTAVSDVVIEAPVAGSVQDIPFQQITAKVKAKGDISEDMILLHLQTPRTQRLRFLAGQRVTLRVGQSFSADLPIASCPCDDRNVLFHLRRHSGNLFSDYVFEHLGQNESVEIEGPQGEFILHEKSPRPLYFFAFDGGFAPIKSLIEHAMSLDAESIHLYWIGSSKAHIYIPNVARAWDDALDNFHYAELVAGFDLRAVSGKRETSLLHQLKGIVENDSGVLQGDIYLAGPESALGVAEQFFLGRGLPKTRVFVEMVN
ncbi:2Fe-2S iron-sulfur cluster-binding protein [Sideroxydans lithotrophicus]|uniref:Ferredoxin n=1 Tax=Sideroxydans lithotrophicus (strain ES-1) TaxID=580332 RepID=D5CSG8_SIDLE|nr:2Fe-2S iron-sulfur cluster-binding protein [Sideroxydans lithotrophicus]ADE11904.1 ferredoxin [Sideroxydans lithotrophicus ES-1]